MLRLRSNHLESILEEINLVTLIGMGSSLLSGPRSTLSIASVLCSVLSSKVPPHNSGNDKAADIVSEVDGVALEVSRSGGLRVGEGADATSCVTDGNDDGSGDTLLE